MKEKIVKLLDLTLIALLLSFTSLAQAPITGDSTVCAGDTIRLGDALAGGSWSSSNAFAATIDASGLVTAFNAGYTTITYTIGASYVTKVVTVNMMPGAITSSTTSVCVGVLTTLTDVSPGGSWSSASPGIATVDPTGIITGVTPGTSVITYRLGTGCATIVTVNILAPPMAITGGSVVCPGGSIILNDGTGGGIWSSTNATVAFVGSSSGTVVGVAPGTVTLRYTTSSTCYASATVTVNAPDPPIVVHPPICVGVPSLPLTEAVSGGSWHSSSPVVGIDSVAGIVTGAASGTAIITYSLGSGCNLTTLISINPLPAPILPASTTICAGQTTTLTDATAGGGAWSSSNISVATVGSITGIATGTAAGPVIINFTSNNTGCSTQATVTVIASPSPITGASSLCSGNSTALIDTTTGGTWSSGTASVATIDAATGIVTSGVAIGATIISYTAPSGCRAVYTVNVNALPSPVSLEALTGAYCAGAAGVNVFLTASNAGVIYQLYNGAAAVGPAVAGTGAALSFGYQTAAGTYKAIATTATTGCSQTMLGGPTIAVSPLPTPYSVSGGGNYCAGGSGVPIGLSNSDAGTFYKLISGSSTVGSEITGIGSVLDFGTISLPGLYKVVATNSEGCTDTMLSSASVSVNPLPTPFSVTGGGSYCATSPALHIGLSSSAAEITYQLYNGTTIFGSSFTGTGSTIDFGPIPSIGSYSVVATNAATGCTSNMTGTKTIAVVSPPAIYAVTKSGSDTFCVGSGGPDVTLAGSQAGENYVLYRNGTLLVSTTAGTGSAIDFGVQAASGTYKVKASDPASVCISAMNDSIVILAHPLPTVYNVSGGGGFCFGGTGVPVNLDASNTGISYQLYVGGAATGTSMTGTGGPISFPHQTTAGSYTIIATDMATGCANNMSGSSTVLYDPAPTPYAVSPASGGGAYCADDTTGIVINVAGSDPGVYYYLYRTGTPSPLYSVDSTSSAAFSFPHQTIPGTYIVVASNFITSCRDTMPGTVHITINALPTVYSVTGTGSLCAGSAGIPIGLSYSDVGINYQLYSAGAAAGSPVPGTGSALTLGLESAADTYTAVATNSVTSCMNNMTGSAAVTVIPTVTPSDSIYASPTTICPGDTVSFHSILVNGGSPSLTWTVNGAVVASGSAFSYVPATGDVVSLAMHSSVPCPSPASVTSSLTMYVVPLPPITGSASICEGSSITLGDTASGGAWTSSDPSVAEIATIGASTGVVITSSPGTSVMTYTIGAGCSVSTTITVNPTPAVSASLAVATCGGIDQLTASGATTYSWSPSAGLSCASCPVTLLTPAATTTYAVVGTNSIGCSATATVTIDGNRISGYITYGTPLTATDSFKIWLIQFNPADSTLIGLDSTYSCLSSGLPYYEFDDLPNGSFMAEAQLLHQPTGPNGYIPTFSNATPYWIDAASVAHTGNADTLHMDMVPITVLTTGSGYISGLIVSGAGKGTNSDAPAQGMLVLLLDAVSNTPLTYTYTDGSGAYSFSHLPDNNYIIYPEDFSYFTTPSSVIMLESSADSAININFKQYTTSEKILPLITTGLNSLTTNSSGILVYPNPSTGDLNIQWNRQAKGTADVMVTDVVGREVYKSTINIDAVSFANGTLRKSLIDLGSLKDGIYLVNIISGDINYTAKLMIQR